MTIRMMVLRLGRMMISVVITITMILMLRVFVKHMAMISNPEILV